jgi:hypothetical protein
MLIIMTHTHTHTHILCIAEHLVHECLVILLLSSSRDFIHNILCIRPKGCTIYKIDFLYGTYLRCRGLELLRKCIHVSDGYELGRKEVSLQSIKYVTYDIY